MKSSNLSQLTSETLFDIALFSGAIDMIRVASWTIVPKYRLLLRAVVCLDTTRLSCAKIESLARWNISVGYWTLASFHITNDYIQKLNANAPSSKNLQQLFAANIIGPAYFFGSNYVVGILCKNAAFLDYYCDYLAANPNIRKRAAHFIKMTYYETCVPSQRIIDSLFTNRNYDDETVEFSWEQNMRLDDHYTLTVKKTKDKFGKTRIYDPDEDVYYGNYCESGNIVYEPVEDTNYLSEVGLVIINEKTATYIFTIEHDEETTIAIMEKINELSYFTIEHNEETTIAITEKINELSYFTMCIDSLWLWHRNYIKAYEYKILYCFTDALQELNELCAQNNLCRQLILLYEKHWLQLSNNSSAIDKIIKYLSFDNQVWAATKFSLIKRLFNSTTEGNGIPNVLLQNHTINSLFDTTINLLSKLRHNDFQNCLPQLEHYPLTDKNKKLLEQLKKHREQELD